MFKELAPLLRQRSVLITATRLEDDSIRVTVIPKKLKDSENQALMTPVSVTGTAEELDTQLPSTLSDFVGSHLSLKNTLETAKAEMDAAAKAAKAEARSKTQSKGSTAAKSEDNKTDKELAKAVEEKKPEAPRTPSLFDTPGTPAPAPATAPASASGTGDVEILAEIAEQEENEEQEEIEEQTKAA